MHDDFISAYNVNIYPNRDVRGFAAVGSDSTNGELSVYGYCRIDSVYGVYYA